MQDDGTAIVASEGETLDPAAKADLAQALERLQEGGGLVVRLADLAGGAMSRTIKFGTRTLGMVPGASPAMQGVVEAALRRAFDIAVLRLGADGEAARNKRLAQPLVVLSGAVGGFIGLGGFVPDAAVTSLTIMREIARIAVEEGEDLADTGTREACLQVFALTPGTKGEEARAEPEASYFSARLMLQGRPLAMLLTDVAARFGLTLSEKFALQAIPVIGAVSGATLNGAFLAHYRKLAQGHFTVRRLERQYGEAAVRAAAG